MKAGRTKPGKCLTRTEARRRLERLDRKDFKHYEECSECRYRKWCAEIEGKYVCTACVIDGPNERFIKQGFRV